jgi:oxygen-independent coproporphyrinogen III oxidase
MSNIKGLYVHIPFCEHICFYCDFCKQLYDEQQASAYLEVLASELASYPINFEQLESIYIGGGTPSALNVQQLTILFAMLNRHDLSNVKEYTIEINPENFTLAKAQLCRVNHINRVSIGVQTFNETILRSLNRVHTKQQVLDAIKYLRAVGIDNISIDLMYGFNNQTIDDLAADLKILAELDIDHVACYSLILEKGTVFNNQGYEIDEDHVYELESFLHQELAKMGYEHYEVSNFARHQKYSYHNLLYWHNEHYYGIGQGASGYLADYRYYNTKSMTKYLQKDFNVHKDYYQSRADLLKDEILLQFRIYNGIDLMALNQKYSLDFTKYFNNAIMKNIKHLSFVENKLYFDKTAQDYLNNILIDFIEEIGSENNE